MPEVPYFSDSFFDLVKHRKAYVTGVAKRKSLKPDYEKMYQAIYGSLNQSEIGDFTFFMNYGVILDENSLSPIRLSKGYYDGNSHQMVLEVIGDNKVDGKDFLDIGCGRGGTCYVLNQHFSPKSYTGIDLSKEAISFCRQEHDYNNATFLKGDAENLPFADASFDVVFNLESSHSYPNLDTFYSEVARVLRSGGLFLYSDIFLRESIERSRLMLQEEGFLFKEMCDITKNVLASCRDVGARRLKFYQKEDERKCMASFLAAPGSDTYQDMEGGIQKYMIFNLFKP